jgi:hypothetical protein
MHMAANRPVPTRTRPELSFATAREHVDLFDDRVAGMGK